MINTILQGFLDISMNVLNWFLDPIWNAISSINLGNTSLADLINSINDLFSMLTNTMSWVVDATGIPRPMFIIMFTIYLSCITMRVAIYLVKMILRWWDKIIA